jgi:hypothetical protein
VGPDCVHHRPHVVHPRLERRDVARAIGEAGSAPVELDHPRESPQPLEERLSLRLLRRHLQVADEAVHEHEVDQAVADDAIGNRDVAALRVPDVNR